jgi:hypothetical protein
MEDTPTLMQRAEREIAAFVEEAENNPDMVDPILRLCIHTHVH